MNSLNSNCLLTSSNLSSILVGGKSGALPSHSVFNKMTPSINSLSIKFFSFSFSWGFSFILFSSSSSSFSLLFLSPSNVFFFFFSILFFFNFFFLLSSFSSSFFFPKSISSFNVAEEVTVLLNIPGGSASNFFSNLLFMNNSISNFVGLVYKFIINWLFISTS